MTKFTEGFPDDENLRKRWEQREPRRRLGRMLESIRRQASLTQSQLADKIGKDQATIARWEGSKGEMPKAENLALFTEGCGLSLAFAFVNVSNKEIVLHQLQPIQMQEANSPAFEAVRDVILSGR